MMRNIRLLGLVSFLAGWVVLGFLAMTSLSLNQPTAGFNLDFPDLGLWEQERDDGGYYTIVDEDNKILDKTIKKVYPDDEFIASNNRHYRVEKVDGDIATARLIMENALADIELEHLSEEVLPVAGGKAKNLIAMYHTHSDESYVPSDGTESIPGNGGIYKVGAQLAEKLKSKGVEVAYDKRPHDPHDADAYRRSRRTAVDLMKNRPAAIIDIHRDGVPDPDFYYENVSGVDVTKVRFVVGRQNQNMQANLDFAKHLKAQMDKYYPGLVHGIFMAKGNYNQDLSPRSMLIEVGTHTNYRGPAETGAALFADAIPAVLGISSPNTPTKTPPINAGKGDTKALWWIIGIALIGGGAFLLLSTGSIKGSLSKLKQFSSDEWSSFLGNPKRRKRAEAQDEELNEERAPFQKD